MISSIIFAVCICFFIFTGFINVGNLIRGHEVGGPAILLMSIFLTGIILHVCGIY